MELPQYSNSAPRKNWVTVNQKRDSRSAGLTQKKLIIYSYLLSYNLLKEVISKLEVDIILTKEIKKASLIVGLKKHIKQNPKLQRLAQKRNIPIYTINQSSLYQVAKLIQFIML